ncbi:MAG: heterodisulfide reductase-related iron-sulfur binding cluster [Dehalococcoidia bacterium]|nr:heterodisulfide reductase-related iron-sulfur binding cluster [Dehalococcoidia bacterium]
MTTITKTNKSAAEQVREQTGANVFLCYQCKKCTLGCPVASEMDLKPNQVMRLLQLGRIDQVLRCKTIWLCASCQTCTTRCPTSIDIARVMDSLKIMAQERGIESKMPASVNFINAGLRSIKGTGRMYELGLMLEMNLKSGKPLRDAGMGLKMLRSGKLRLIPERAGFPSKLKKKDRPADANSVAYYPGCSLHASGAEYDKSYKAVAAALGIKLVEPKGWVCCGTTAAHWKSHKLATDLPLKNLALIESEGHKAVSVPCALCFSRLKHAAYDVGQDPSLKDGVTRQTGYDFTGAVSIENAVDSIVNRVGLDKVAGMVKKPAAGLKAVCYYGCLLTRPPKVTGAGNPEYPMNMDKLMQALGVKTLDWSYKTECCGGSMSIIDLDTCLNMVKRILDNAKAVGADVIISACPMCHSNLDTRQPALSTREGQKYDVPVLYFSQLLALSLGLGEKKADLEGHMVNARPVLTEKGLLP